MKRHYSFSAVDVRIQLRTSRGRMLPEGYSDSYKKGIDFREEMKEWLPDLSAVREPHLCKIDQAITNEG
jgi:hypothetical protein